MRCSPDSVPPAGSAAGSRASSSSAWAVLKTRACRCPVESPARSVAFAALAARAASAGKTMKVRGCRFQRRAWGKMKRKATKRTKAKAPTTVLMKTRAQSAPTPGRVPPAARSRRARAPERAAAMRSRITLPAIAIAVSSSRSRCASDWPPPCLCRCAVAGRCESPWVSAYPTCGSRSRVRETIRRL